VAVVRRDGPAAEWRLVLMLFEVRRRWRRSAQWSSATRLLRIV
jgi:hypothetical protein